MPIYEYQCKSCGNELEALQKVNDTPLTKCPECGLKKLQKNVSAAAFRLKGTGWYETDFKDQGEKNKLSASKAEKEKATSSNESKAGDKDKGSTTKQSSGEKSASSKADTKKS